MGIRDFAVQSTSGAFLPLKDAVETPQTLLRQRRAAIIAETAGRLLKGRDPDSDVLPMLYEALAAERLVDASLGFIVTEGSETMKLGFIKGFPLKVAQRCLTLDFGQAVCGTVAATRQAMHVTNIQQLLDPLADLVPVGRNDRLCLRAPDRRRSAAWHIVVRQPHAPKFRARRPAVLPHDCQTCRTCT